MRVARVRAGLEGVLVGKYIIIFFFFFFFFCFLLLPSHGRRDLHDNSLKALPPGLFQSLKSLSEL